VEITEVRIKLMEESSERLQAFCSITFDNSFVIRDLKIIDGANGPFVAMPSRKLTAHCPGCGYKNHLRAAHCNQCGGRLSEDRLVKDEDGRAKLYADIAHPINSACREMIQQRVIREFQVEIDRSKQPGYRSTYDDYDHDVEIPPEPRDAKRESGKPEPVKSESPARSTTQVQPAESQPPRPHKPPQRTGTHGPRANNSQASTPHSTPHSSPNPTHRDNFGAGIF
jgi:stage V sporulation protein G